MDYIDVDCMGLPVFDFPVELVDPTQDKQVVFVPFIIVKNVTYGTGAYVQLERKGRVFNLTKVGLQPHVMSEV